MIKINLLPLEHRLVEVQERKFSPQAIVLGLFLIILLASLYQSFLYIGLRSKIHQLNSNMSQLKGPSTESDELSQLISTKLLPEKRFFNQYILPGFLMAEVLNVLSDLLPESIWLADLNIKRERDAVRLELSGYSKITSKQIAVAQIQEYVNEAKAKIETILNQKVEEGRENYEVKATLTTNLKEISSVEAMQFNASFKTQRTEKKV